MGTNSLAALVAVGICFAAQAGTVVPVPALPAYGQPVQIQVVDPEGPQYLPATRFVRSGATIVVDYEYVHDGFGPIGPDFGYAAVSIGELVPGDYIVEARLLDIAQPDMVTRSLRASFSVGPPVDWGVYLVPSAPAAWEAANVLVHSAAYFDPATLRLSLAANVIRVDFDYAGDAPVGGPAPPGYVAFAAVGFDGLAPGLYRVEGYGRERAGGTPQKFFTLDVGIATPMPVIEYYNEYLDHYFLAGGPDEVKLLDAGAFGGWKRSGQKLKGWLHEADAPLNARAVCRFYARGPNSHFFTADASECRMLKELELSQRSQAAAGSVFLGWAFEGIGFWALVPEAGQCPPDSDPVFRFYNNRAAEDDSNHRFTFGGQMHNAMSASWIDEGVQLCSPH